MHSGARRGPSSPAAGGTRVRARAPGPDARRAGVASITLLLAIASTSFVAGLSLNAFLQDARVRHDATVSERDARQLALEAVIPPRLATPGAPLPAASRASRADPSPTPEEGASPRNDATRRTPASPRVEQPAEPAAARRRPESDARAATRREIVVSLEQKRLWLMDGTDTVLTSPIAVASNDTFTYGDKVYRFVTPRGHLRILSKVDDPKWIPPDWHYYEKAVDRGLEVVRLAENDSVPLSDGSAIVVRNGNVGRINRRGQYWDWTPGMEIMIDGKIFIPPKNSPQRRVPDALGPYKLGLGNGIYIHGTNSYDSTSIGTAASHGCIRMPNVLLRQLYDSVGVGTPVLVH